jgi:hypothetical protein
MAGRSVVGCGMVWGGMGEKEGERSWGWGGGVGGGSLSN